MNISDFENIVKYFLKKTRGLRIFHSGDDRRCYPNFVVFQPHRLKSQRERNGMISAEISYRPVRVIDPELNILQRFDQSQTESRSEQALISLRFRRIIVP